MTQQAQSLNELVYALEAAKLAETIAKQQRVSCEQSLIEALGITTNQHNTTHKTEYYKIVIKPTVNYRYDDSVAIPDEITECIIRIKKEVNVAAFKQLESEQPELFKIAQNAIITSAGKTQVSIERIGTKHE